MFGSGFVLLFMGGSRGGSWSGPIGKSEVAIGYLRKCGTDTCREAIGPIGSNCFSREVRTTLSEKRR